MPQWTVEMKNEMAHDKTQSEVNGHGAVYNGGTYNM